MVQQVGLKQGLLNELLKWILYFRGSRWIEVTIHDEMWCRFCFSNNNNKINIGKKTNSLMLIRGHSQGEEPHCTQYCCLPSNMNFGDPGPKSSGSTLWCLPTSLDYRHSASRVPLQPEAEGSAASLADFQVPPCTTISALMESGRS